MLELRPVPEEARPDWVATLTDRVDLLRFRQQYGDAQEAHDKAQEFVEGVQGTSSMFEVVDGDDPVGHVWWGLEGESASVMDAGVPARASTRTVMRLS